MKIKRLHLKNFRKHADSLLHFGEAWFIVIRGKNFAGKSSIRQALSMCFTPSTTGLDAAGRGFHSKIKRGSDKAVITSDIQGRRHLIQRTVTLNTNTTGRTQKSICLNDPDWNPALFDKQIEENRDALTVVLNTEAFLRMDEREQKNLLAHLALPARYDFDAGIVTAVNKALASSDKGAVNFEGDPFEAITTAYDKLFEERKIANRQVKDFVLPEELASPGSDSHTLQEQLSALREERRRRVQERDRAVEEAGKEELGRTRAKAKLDALEEGIGKERERANGVRKKLQPEDRLAYLRKVAAGKEELDRLSKQQTETGKLIYDHQVQLAELAKVRGGKNCPTCEGPLDVERLAAMKDRLERLLREWRETQRLEDQKIHALGEVGTAVELVAGHEKTLAELKVMEASIAEKQCQVEQDRQALPVPVEFDFQPFDRTIGECDAEIERLAGLLRPAIVAEERAKEIVVKREQLHGLKERAGLLDVLVKYFDKDKDGIKAKLLRQYIGGFEHKINETMSAWGYACSLCIDPYSFDVTNADGDVIPVRELSGAEGVMFSLAFQCAVARTANIGLVVVDEVAMFLPELRPVMNKCLYEMVANGYLEQVIMLVADASEQVPRLAGAAFYMVDRGVVRKLGAAAA